MRLPESGRDWAALEADMDDFASGDIDWRRGRTPLYVFYANDDVHEVGRAAYMKYFTENALGGKRAFFSVARMEREVVAMALDLLHAGEGATGHMSSGGSESIFLAVKAARDWFRAEKPAARGPLNMVVPYSAHPAFNKAAEAMDLDVRRLPLDEGMRADPEALAGAVDERTFLLVGSAPCFPHGTIDPIDEIGRIAEAHDIWLHVDACVGGYLAPFVARAGYPVPAFDFAVPGVRSISADLHKYGFCPKPASTVFYRHQADFDRAAFDFTDWPNGRFATPTLSGTRPGGAVAAAWAVLNYLGAQGYEAIARQLMATRDAYIEGITAIDGYRLVGRPDLTILNFTTDAADVFLVAEELGKRGWLVGLTRRPKGLHLMLSMKHAEALPDYLADLDDCTRIAKGSNRESTLSAAY